MTDARRRPAPEPTARIPLAWGEYQGRMVVGVGLLIGGAALVAQTTVYTIGLGLLGSALHVAGWAVQPARGGTRALVALPCMLACWATISGPQTMWLLALCLASWLAVRERPPLAYLTLLLPIGVGLGAAAAFSHAADKRPAFLLVLGSVLGGAWLARQLALRPKALLTEPIGTAETECTDTP
jgi:hypothetical protein